ncbi:MAG: hypothetical protein QM674_17005 [Burkholderiaceae bacterium]
MSQSEPARTEDGYVTNEAAHPQVRGKDVTDDDRWGICRDDIEPTRRRRMPHAVHVETVRYGFHRDSAGRLLPIISRTRGLRELLPSIVGVRLSRGT